MIKRRIAFQGELGANSHEACSTYYPDYEPVPCATFEEAFEAVQGDYFDRDADAYAVTAQHPGFAALLRAEGIDTVVVCGLATNICCFFAARDLRRAGFDVRLVEDASAGIDVPTAGLFQTKAKEEGLGLGIQYVTTDDVTG